MNAPLLTVALSLACLAASGADSWKFLPPRDVDPALAQFANPIPRRWSGQKASLVFSALGITDRGEVRVGRPSIRVRMNPTDRQCIWYNAVGVNMPEAQQAEQLSVLYTPAYGASFGVSYAGCVTVVSGGKVTAYGAVGPGDRTAIPADGFVLLMSDTYMGYIPAGQYVAPAVGEGMELEYYLYQPDEEVCYMTSD